MKITNVSCDVQSFNYRLQTTEERGLLKSTAQSPVQFTEDCGTIGERMSRKERERERENE